MAFLSNDSSPFSGGKTARDAHLLEPLSMFSRIQDRTDSDGVMKPLKMRYSRLDEITHGNQSFA